MIAKPSTKLMKKDVRFEWGVEQQKAFETLRDALTNAPVLAHYQSNLPIEVRTDASGYGVGAVILEQHGKNWKAVAYVSRQMNKHELNYTISEKESLAIVFAIGKFKIYLDQKPFRVVTDHCALCFLKTKKQLPPRLTRWALLLQEYDMEIVYKNGRHHHDADCLSRYLVSEPTDESNQEERVHAFATLTELGSDRFAEEQLRDSFCQRINTQLENKESLSRRKNERLRSLTELIDVFM